MKSANYKSLANAIEKACGGAIGAWLPDAWNEKGYIQTSPVMSL